MILTLELYEALLTKKVGIVLSIKESTMFPGYLRIIPKDKRIFSLPEQRIMVKYSTKGTMFSSACFHVLVGELNMEKGIIEL